MVIHKRIRLTPLDRQEIWRLWQTRRWKVSALAKHFRVSRPTIYKALARARKNNSGDSLPRIIQGTVYLLLIFDTNRLGLGNGTDG